MSRPMNPYTKDSEVTIKCKEQHDNGSMLLELSFYWGAIPGSQTSTIHAETLGEEGEARLNVKLHEYTTGENIQAIALLKQARYSSSWETDKIYLN